MKDCREVKGTVPLQGVHRLAVWVALGPQLGLHCGHWPVGSGWPVGGGEPQRKPGIAEVGQIVSKGGSRA